jgi:hypothetical protein
MLTTHLLPLLTALLAGTASAAVVVQVAGRDGGLPMFVTAAVGSSSAFRLSVEFAATATAAPLSSPSLDAGRALAKGTKTSGPNGSVGIKTSFGELRIDRDGRFELFDADGARVAHATAKGPAISTEATGYQGITMGVSGSKTGPGANGRRPCLTNGGWGPPYTWDPVDK